MEPEIANKLQKILNESTIKPTAVFQYGSRVYGTATKDSDWDFVIVEEDPQSENEIIMGEINIKLFGIEQYQKLLNEHNITALECYFLPSEFVIQNAKHFKFKLNGKLLRSSLMEKSSKSWVKAKKKFLSPYDNQSDELYRGKKSLFHSLRIVNFGQQISRFGKIVDYSEINSYYEQIMNNPSESWEDYDLAWRRIYNESCTSFRTYCSLIR